MNLYVMIFKNNSGCTYPSLHVLTVMSYLINLLRKHGVNSLFNDLISKMSRVIEPDFSLQKMTLPEQRRAILLSWILISLSLLIGLVLLLIAIVDPLTSSRSLGYIGLILILFLLLIIAFALNRRGKYFIAAGLTIACAITGPWASILIDPTILQGDLIPLLYLNVTILLSSFLLTPLVTMILA